MDKTMKITKAILMAIFFGLILSGCKKNEVLLPENNEPEIIEPETPDFGFAGENSHGQFIIKSVDSLTVDLPADYQTVSIKLEPIDPTYCNTPDTKSEDVPALVNGEWEYTVKYAEDDRSAVVNISAEYPLFTEALLSITIIDPDGLENKINKVVRRDVSEDYVYDKATKTYTVKSLYGLRMINKLLYTYINDESYDNDDINVLMACDVNFHESEEHEEQNWIPITDRTNGGGYTHYYQGTFDGAGHTIGGISMAYNLDYMGLFGFLGENAVVKNLILEDAYIWGDNYVGAIAGWSEGIITDCESNSLNSNYSGPVWGAKEVGGLVGDNWGKIIRCKRQAEGFWVSISGEESTGGICGSNRGLIDQCTVVANNHDISSDCDYAGGIAGFSNGIISNCSVKGNGSTMIVAERCCGGIAGNLNGRAIINCSVSNIQVQSKGEDNEWYGAIAGLTNTHLLRLYIVGCYTNNVSIISNDSKVTIAGDIRDRCSIIGCFSYQNSYGTPDDDELHIVEEEGGFFGPGSGKVLQSYYQAAESSPLFGVDTEAAELATTWDEAIIKMNEAIDKYNETAEVKCEGKWSGTMTNPVFLTETNN